MAFMTEIREGLTPIQGKVTILQGRAKEMFPCLKIPALVLPGNLASPCTANQPILESSLNFAPLQHVDP